MVENENKNSSNNSNNETNEVKKTASEKVSASLKKGESEDLLKMARRQKAEFDMERAEWEAGDKERAKNEMELLRENTHIKKELSDVKKAIEKIKYQSVLDQEMKMASDESNQTGEQVKLTPDQKVNQIFMEVIKERKERALKKKEEKKDNVYYV